MASTGVYGSPRYELLERAGFQGLLVAPRQGPRAPNRPKTDVQACPWLPRRHSLGLRTAACRPEAKSRGWRSYQRPRAPLSEDAGRPLQRLEKTLEEMNVKVTEGVSDLTGVTGRRRIRAIGQGARDAPRLAQWRAHRGKERAKTIALALPGPWRPEHLCALQQSRALQEYDPQQRRVGDRVLAESRRGLALPAVAPLEPTRRVRRRQDNAPTFDARQRLHQVTGVARTVIEGIEGPTALGGRSAIGTDMSRWPSEKPWGSGLGLAPNPKQSGGRMTSSATRLGGSRAF